MEIYCDLHINVLLNCKNYKFIYYYIYYIIINLLLLLLL